MDESSNKDKEDAEYSEEIKTLVKNLMNFHSQKNIIRFTFKNVLSFNEKVNEVKKDYVKVRTSGKCNFY